MTSRTTAAILVSHAVLHAPIANVATFWPNSKETNLNKLMFAAWQSVLQIEFYVQNLQSIITAHMYSKPTIILFRYFCQNLDFYLTAAYAKTI